MCEDAGDVVQAREGDGGGSKKVVPRNAGSAEATTAGVGISYQENTGSPSPSRPDSHVMRRTVDRHKLRTCHASARLMSRQAPFSAQGGAFRA